MRDFAEPSLAFEVVVNGSDDVVERVGGSHVFQSEVVGGECRLEKERWRKMIFIEILLKHMKFYLKTRKYFTNALYVSLMPLGLSGLVTGLYDSQSTSSSSS